MKILVTGGAGFVGSHLCEALASKQIYEVYSLDNYSTGSLDNHVDNVNYIEGSTSEIDQLIKFNPDLIFHLGEYSRVEQSFNDLDAIFDSNVKGTTRVLDFCIKTKAKLVYAGSSTKFGDNGLGSNQSPYAFTKAKNTELVQNYSDWFGLDYAITYFYNVFGGREIRTGQYATVIGIFKNNYINKKINQVVSPGTQLRNFTHIDDIVRGLIAVGLRGNGDGFGIGNPKSYSIFDIAKMFSVEYEMLPERKGNRMSGALMVEKTLELGVKAEIDLEDHIINFKNSIDKIT